MVDVAYLLNAYIAIILIVDPLGNIPLFLAFTAPFSPKDQRFIINRAVLIGFLVLLFFTVTGNLIFQALGVKMYSFRIAGGILLFIISIEMLFGRKSRTETSNGEEELSERKTREELAVAPMAIPLLAGPGAITAGVVLYNLAPDPFHQMLLLIIIFLVFITSYILFLNAQRIFQILGRTGTTVLIRIMGLLLAAIAVQFILSGIGEAVQTLI